jgi:cytochrome b
LDKLCRSCHGNKKEGFKKNWIPFMKLCRNIHSSVWQLLGVLKKIKMAAVAMATKVQNGRQIQKSSDLG